MPFRSAFSQLFSQDSTIAGVVFFVVLAVLGVSMLLSRRRRRRGQGPSHRAEANRLEAGYVMALAGIVTFLIFSSLTENHRETDPSRPAVRVEVIAYQWCWRFHYEGQPVTVTGQCQGGRLPTLVLPVGRPVELDVTSIDVIHAFWVPYLRYKTYAYPDHVNSFTVTLSRTGRWIGRCAQICGLYHYEMDFYVEAVSPAAFSTFLRSRGGTTAGISQ